jgi:hypothetical protein
MTHLSLLDGTHARPRTEEPPPPAPAPAPPANETTRLEVY